MSSTRLLRRSLHATAAFAGRPVPLDVDLLRALVPAGPRPARGVQETFRDGTRFLARP